MLVRKKFHIKVFFNLKRAGIWNPRGMIDGGFKIQPPSKIHLVSDTHEDKCIDVEDANNFPVENNIDATCPTFEPTSRRRQCSHFLAHRKQQEGSVGYSSSCPVAVLHYIFCSASSSSVYA